MASFQKYTTKDGPRWMYKYYGAVDPATGKKKPSSKRGFMTKKEAQLHAAQTEKAVEEGTFVKEDTTTTFDQVYELWYETNRSGWKPPTRRAVRSKFNAQLLPRFKNAIMKNITKSYCQDVINKMFEEGFKTIDNYKMYANQIFEFAIEQEIISKNPMQGVKIPRREDQYIVEESKEEEQRNFWEKAEIKKFLGIMKKDYPFMDYCLFHLFIYTGARKGEILDIRHSDVDFKNKTLRLKKTLYYDKENGYMSLTSKTPASRRVISLDDTSLGLLRKMITGENKGNIVHIHQQDNPNKNKFIFSRENGDPLRLAYPNDKLDEVIRIYRLHPITVHGLRHTHASLLFEAGATIKEVQERLGHSDIKMTMNIYTHVTKTVKELTATRFEKFMELDDEVTESEEAVNEHSK
ncbi:site-specific integrase [Paenibacillus vini]|uniref:site-specific integrase n=1 Tax=Paenibacillus vini TaxID=1476024 RepID=UPI0025B6CBDA|nr:site-specific integrase [Paenibacillus vini]MDN4069231.1 site-specific integrase [Paenibacillus vini]MDN4069284.1 site-specific integrase [Paenibacillus vini]